MVFSEVLFEEDRSIRPDFVVCIAAHAHDQPEHCSIGVHRSLSTLLDETCKETVAELAALILRFTVGELTNFFDRNELHVREVNLAHYMVENLSPPVFKLLVFLKLIRDQLNCELEQALVIVFTQQL
jgi:hypothetical protein